MNKIIYIQQQRSGPPKLQPSFRCSSSKLTTTTQLNAKESNKNDDDDNMKIGEDQFEWDGVVVEGAHDADFDSIDTTDNTFMPSISLLSMANAVPSPVMDVANNGGGETSGSGSDSNFDPLKNMGKIHQLALEDEVNEENLLEMGGDPSFLDSDDDDDMKFSDMDDANLFGGWDGTVDEEAHMD